MTKKKEEKRRVPSGVPCFQRGNANDHQLPRDSSSLSLLFIMDKKKSFFASIFFLGKK